MRPIKFRGWDEKRNIMHYDFQFIKSGDEGNDWIIFISDKHPLTDYQTNPFTNPNPHFTQQFKIMQFTGLHDKNGKEIWEKDIIRVGVEGIVPLLDTIIFQFGCFSLEKWSCPLIEEASWCEVFGNIYENPELIEKSQN